ncbi:hypothetical protein L208DRAFT_1529453 [Tricholoma matsutake]|nr:hypothetical protein L208DRAFT_1529453 [Tricholoma matsutake 945]
MPKVHGGWQMMVMVTSGSVVRNAMNWDFFTGLISNGLLDIFIAFGGQETMAHDIQPFVNGLVERVAVHGINVDPWETVSETLVAFPTSITTNTVIAICKTTSGFTASQIGMHRAEQPLGYAFTKCGTANCPSQGHPGHIIGELKDDTVRIQCKTCKWKSKFVKLDSQSFFTWLNKGKAPLLFRHVFPSPDGLSTMFL